MTQAEIQAALEKFAGEEESQVLSKLLSSGIALHMAEFWYEEDSFCAFTRSAKEGVASSGTDQSGFTSIEKDGEDFVIGLSYKHEFDRIQIEERRAPENFIHVGPRGNDEAGEASHHLAASVNATIYISGKEAKRGWLEPDSERSNLVVDYFGTFAMPKGPIPDVAEKTGG
ncbi:MAG: hypothetical protein ACR652_01590 [Methylocystis sp.]|uniref:hypothetical protein n=1 Tax=Methylocystis sp. TaxID=1911079 RepID=UPI003DA4F4C5